MASALPLAFPLPAIDVLLPAPGKWEREHQAFRRLLPELLTMHRVQFVAIHQGKIVASGLDKLAVALQALRQIGNVAIHVGLISEEGEPPARSGVRRVLI
jgi:hypothetical protein